MNLCSLNNLKSNKISNNINCINNILTDNKYKSTTDKNNFVQIIANFILDLLNIYLQGLSHISYLM